MSNNERLQEIAAKFEYMLEEDDGGSFHSYLAPLYLQLQILKRLESIDNSLVTISASLRAQGEDR